MKIKYINPATFTIIFPHFWRLKIFKITSFSNILILNSLFGEISPIYKKKRAEIPKPHNEV
jgi:hypothetical protein